MLEKVTRITNNKKKMLLSERNMRFYIWNGVLLSIVTSLYKPYAQKFLLRLNGTNFDISLFNALPGLVALFTIIPGILMINRVKNKKKTITLSFITSRLFILTLVLVPIMPKQIQPIVFIMLVSVMNFPDAVSTTALQSFTGEIFEGHQSSVAISDRNKYSAFINFVILIILGIVMKEYGSSNQITIEIYQILFILAFIIGIFEIITFCKLREIKPSNSEEGCLSEKPNIKELLNEVKSNKKFMIFMLCSMTFHFGWQMGWPLFSIYQMNNLGADELWLTILGVTSGIAMFVSFNFWKRLILSKGNPFTIACATFGMAITPIIFALSPNLYVLTAAGLITGFFTAGTTNVIVSSLLEVSAPKNRDIYFGVHATLTSLTLFISPFLGNLILSHTNIYVALCVTSSFRFLGSFAFIIRSKYLKKLNSKGTDQ